MRSTKVAPTSGERAVRLRWSEISTGWPTRCSGAQPAGGVGQDDGPHARPRPPSGRRARPARRRGPRRGGCGRGRAAPGGRRPAPTRTSPPWPDGGRGGEAGQLADGDRGLGRPERVGGRRPARAHHDGDVGAAAEGGGEGVGGGGRGRAAGSVPGGGAGTVHAAKLAQHGAGGPGAGTRAEPASRGRQRGPSSYTPAGADPVPVLAARQPRAWSGSCSSSTGRPAS